jgi:hypothetical protein
MEEMNTGSQSAAKFLLCRYILGLRPNKQEIELKLLPSAIGRLGWFK